MPNNVVRINHLRPKDESTSSPTHLCKNRVEDCRCCLASRGCLSASEFRRLPSSSEDMERRVLYTLGGAFAPVLAAKAGEESKINRLRLR